MTSDERGELYNSMTSEQQAQYRSEMKRQYNDMKHETQESLKKAGGAISESVHKKGIVGTLLEGAAYLGLRILLGGK